METVENLMIGKHAYLLVAIDESRMEGLLNK